MGNVKRTKVRILTWACAAIVTGAAGLATAEEWPRYRGPNWDGTTSESVPAWPASGPKVVWKQKLGEGFGSFAISQGKALVFTSNGQDSEQEAVFAFDATTGKPLWNTVVGETMTHDAAQGGNCPRSTPTIDGDKVYVLGTFLKLACLNLADGKPLWSHDLTKDFNGRGQLEVLGIKRWGAASSPIVTGDLVIVAGGGPNQTAIAFNKKTGKVAWKALTDDILHATPTLAEIDGVKQVIFFLKSGLVAVEPTNGKELWRYKFRYNISTAASPVVAGNLVYCSAAYDVGAAVCEVKKSAGGKFTVKELWRKEGEDMNHWSTPVYHDGYLYGVFGWKRYALGCVDIKTGKQMWSKPGVDKGGVILVKDGVLVQEETGGLVLIEASPAAYKELARTKPLMSPKVMGGEKCWTMPVVADGLIYTKSNAEGACLDPRGK